VSARLVRRLGTLALGLVAAVALLVLPAAVASADAAPVAARAATVGTTSATALDVRMPDVPGPNGPNGPTGTGDDGNDTSVTVDLGGLTNKPSTSVTVIIAMTLLSLLPAILLTCTSFTKILVVLGLTRNALGLQQTPPNQVLAGLALFLSLFIMAPVLGSINDTGVQPYLHGTKTSAQAWNDGVKPLKTFMLEHTDKDELTLLTSVAKRDLPKNKDDVSMATLVPAFVLSELKQAFIIGFIVFIPFLVIDIVVSGALMALGMMMMPPVMVSLPFKLLLFVLVDGWGLVIRSIVASYQTG
jgi:flagellar biosynthesis protein FliP